MEKQLKKYPRDYGILFLMAGLIIALDQWTKALVRDNLPTGGMWVPPQMEWLMPYARIVHWYNAGAAFGFFQDGRLVFTILAIVVSILIIYYYPRISRADWTLRLAMGLQLGGAVGNLIDRLTIGSVTDFISVGTFPVFNVADSSITMGVIVLLLGAWLKERAAKKGRAQAEPDAAPASVNDEAKGE